MNHCYFDKRGLWHICDNPELQGDCIDCQYESVIAKTVSMLCHWCGKTIEANHIMGFCNRICQINWQSARLSYEHDLDGGMYWSEDFGIVPCFTLEQVIEVQSKMLGFSHILK